ncbi:hypothetical protein RRG08_005578, partial [Elysia crispata]
EASALQRVSSPALQSVWSPRGEYSPSPSSISLHQGKLVLYRGEASALQRVSSPALQSACLARSMTTWAAEQFDLSIL